MHSPIDMPIGCIEDAGGRPTKEPSSGGIHRMGIPIWGLATRGVLHGFARE
jgi:hypothetical protein